MNDIDQILKDHGLKPGVIAAKSGLSQAKFWRIRAGRSVPTVDDAVRIVAVIRDCTGKDIRVEDFWPATAVQPQEAA